MKVADFSAIELRELLLSDFADLYDRQLSIYGLSDPEGQLTGMRESHLHSADGFDSRFGVASFRRCVVTTQSGSRTSPVCQSFTNHEQTRAR